MTSTHDLDLIRHFVIGMISSEMDMPHWIRKALQERVVDALGQLIENDIQSKRDVLTRYLADAADIEQGKLVIHDLEKIDAKFWVDQIEEYAFDSEAIDYPAKQVLKTFRNYGWIDPVPKFNYADYTDLYEEEE